MDTETDDLNAALAEAWDSSESTEEAPETEQEAPETEQEAPVAEQEAPETEQEAPETNQEAPETNQEAGGDTGTGATDFAPKSLSAAAREVWRDVPHAMKQDILKREQDYQRGIQKYAEDAKRAEQMDQALQPFQQLFAMNGGPGNMLPGLLETASMLQMGSPVQRAQAAAGIIQQFGVDIRTLDNLLTGQGAPAEMQQQDQVQQAVQQAMAPYQQYMQQQQMQMQQQEQMQQQGITQEIQEFATKNEFYHDVRSSMADIMDLAANQGRDMTLKEAYETACQLNPEIRGILASREKQAQLLKSQKAASSIHGTPGGEGSAAPPESMRSAIEAAWDNTGRV